MLVINRIFPKFPRTLSHSPNVVIDKIWCIHKVPLQHSFDAAPRKTARLRLLHSESPVAMSVGQRTVTSDIGSSCNSSNCRKLSTVFDQTTKKMPEVKPFERLPDNVRPKHYKLSLVPDLKSFTFRGDVSIHLEVGLFSRSPYAGICRVKKCLQN